MHHFAMCKQPSRLTPSKTIVYKKAANPNRFTRNATASADADDSPLSGSRRGTGSGHL
jgi:hypothetical protein